MRGKSVQIQESTDVVAIRPGLGAAGRMPRKDGPRRGRRTSAAEFIPDVQPNDVKALENAGWKLVKPDEVRQYGDGMVSAKVFVKPGGALALGTDRLTVKLKGASNAESAQHVLDPFGIRVVNALKFAPGLYEVEIASKATAKDALEVADELMNAGVVEFAEPEFLEILGPR
jgi:hypothetical protein